MAGPGSPLRGGGTSGPQQIAAGTNHACVVMVSGLVQCWGQGFYGNLGNGSSLDRAIPTPTVGLPGPPHTASAVSAGIFTSCAVTASLSAACWGQMVGDGSALTTTHTSAVGVKNLPAGGVSQVSAAYGGCALVRLGGLATGLRCWGDNSSGELGNGSTTNSTSPVQVSGLTGGVVAIGGGGAAACATLFTGQVECWGDNSSGQLGDGSIGGISTTPVAVSGFTSNGASIGTIRGATSCSLNSSQVPECWGNNHEGELGDGGTADSGTPVVVQGL
ncbi:MAG TPA: hypothetical protein VGI05_05415 [Streptosporangiaceae bacterium]|jgi:alpha-tubulin suppressor-like RCC1 family protein